ncbi:MAG: hypothetical protein ACI80I_001263, partial [Akkermansiaceae bacterium]
LLFEVHLKKSFGSDKRDASCPAQEKYCVLCGRPKEEF